MAVIVIRMTMVMTTSGAGNGLCGTACRFHLGGTLVHQLWPLSTSCGLYLVASSYPLHLNICGLQGSRNFLVCWLETPVQNAHRHVLHVGFVG